MSGEEGEGSEGGSMRIDPARAKLLVENLQHVAQRVDAVRGSRKVRYILIKDIHIGNLIDSIHRSAS